MYNVHYKHANKGLELHVWYSDIYARFLGITIFGLSLKDSFSHLRLHDGWKLRLWYESNKTHLFSFWYGSIKDYIPKILTKLATRLERWSGAISVHRVWKTNTALPMLFANMQITITAWNYMPWNSNICVPFLGAMSVIIVFLINFYGSFPNQSQMRGWTVRRDQ